MQPVDTNILEAALRAFSRYGVKRTNMNDLYEEAGVSRQTLYNRFRNKTDILRGLIGYYTDTGIERIERGLKDAPELADKLDLIFEHMVFRGFDIVQTMPNAEDFITGVISGSEAALDQSAAKFRAVITQVLAPHETALIDAGLTLSALSDFIQSTADAAGKTASDRPQLSARLDVLKQLCVNATGQNASAASQSKEN